MELTDNIKLVMKTHEEVVQRIIENDNLIYEIERASLLILDAVCSGHTVYTIGNGGSAADAQHMAAELVGRFYLERNGYRAVALTTDTSILTAVANDYGYDQVFSRQIEALGSAEDVLVAFSTSGKSPGILRAVKKAKKLGMNVIGFTGSAGGSFALACDIPLVVPSEQTPRIQEAHALIYHIICELVEKAACSRTEDQ